MRIRPPGIKDLVEAYVGRDPAFEREIIEENLFSEYGIFQFAALYADTPRIATMLRISGIPVAHAMLMPTTIGLNGCRRVEGGFGTKVGLVGVFVRPGYRGQGFAGRCISRIGEIIEPATKRRKICIVAENRIVALCERSIAAKIMPRRLDR